MLDDNFIKLKAMHSCDWALEMHAVFNSFFLILGWNAEAGKSRPESRWISISFECLSLYAVADYTRLWQHPSTDRDLSVLTFSKYESEMTHMTDLTLNLESFPEGWFKYRVEAQSDAVDIICRKIPLVKFYKSEPEILKWWSQGYSFK